MFLRNNWKLIQLGQQSELLTVTKTSFKPEKTKNSIKGLHHYHRVGITKYISDVISRIVG